MRPIIIIDPGHGGRDPGGGSNTYWEEKDLNLEISLYQYQRFHDLGIKTIVTRDDDVTLEPITRAKIVRDSGAIYCISNHINAGGGEGAEVIYSIYGNQNLAQKLLDGIVVEGMPRRGIFTRALPQDPKHDYYFMHRETGAVETFIVEYGFADNARDVTRLKKNWKKYAEGVVKVMVEYLGVKYVPPKPKEEQLQMEKIKVSIHGQQKEIEGFKKDGMNYIPIRFLEQLGYKVDWDSSTETVYIDYRKE
ncbi:MAG: N-acetylmuramoyl-L-alanine amidase [Epulopiscium sp.]|nr:N-acetylmuramoyl-L-alanine amidase [Candidatus Epulonipiscium sp.]